jgi:predicted transcriptional regulator
VANWPEKESDMARAILEYLQGHPDAKDTLEGIAQWWLLKEWTERKHHEIETSLADLVSKGLVMERKREGMPPYYRLNRAKQDEITQILDCNSDEVSSET